MWRRFGIVLWCATILCYGKTGPVFPQQFTVSVGTTIVHHTLDSIAQAGTIYFDHTNQRMRLEHWYLGHQLTYLARYDDKKIYIITDGECSYHNVQTGSLLPYSLPEGSVKHAQAELVRSTLVNHYEAVVSAVGLQRVDFFIRPLNATLSAAVQSGSEDKKVLFIPWRTIYQQSRRKEIGPTSESVNMDAEGDVSMFTSVGDMATIEEIREVITDYYNFNPTPPDPNLFVAPQMCTKATDPFFAESAGGGVSEPILPIYKRLVDISLFEGSRKFLAATAKDYDDFWKKCTRKYETDEDVQEQAHKPTTEEEHVEVEELEDESP